MCSYKVSDLPHKCDWQRESGAKLLLFYEIKEFLEHKSNINAEKSSDSDKVPWKNAMGRWGDETIKRRSCWISQELIWCQVLSSSSQNCKCTIFTMYHLYTGLYFHSSFGAASQQHSNAASLGFVYSGISGIYIIIVISPISCQNCKLHMMLWCCDAALLRGIKIIYFTESHPFLLSQKRLLLKPDFTPTKVGL